VQFPITVEGVRRSLCPTPHFGQEYLAPFGSTRSQRCRFVGYLGEDFFVEKFRAKSGRWTKPRPIACLAEIK